MPDDPTAAQRRQQGDRRGDRGTFETETGDPGGDPPTKPGRHKVRGVADRLQRMSPDHGWRSGGIRHQQAFIGQNIDHPRDAAAGFGNSGQRGVVKDVVLDPLAAGHPQAMGDVALGFGQGQRLCLKREDHPLVQLAQRRILQQFVQFGLTEQDDLQQLAGFGLEIGDQANGLQSGLAQMLCLVDHHHRHASLGMFIHQETVQRRVGRFLHRGVIDGEFPTNRPNDGTGVSLRRIDVGDGVAVDELVHQQTAQQRLAGSHLADDFDDAGIAPQREIERRDDVGVFLGRIIVIGVGRQREGMIGQPEMCEIGHGLTFPAGTAYACGAAPPGPADCRWAPAGRWPPGRTQPPPPTFRHDPAGWPY